MKLVQEEKTYEVTLEESSEFPTTRDVVMEILRTMPDWGLSEYRFDYDTWTLYVTVRRIL